MLFEWSSLDHISPDKAILPINPGQAGSGYNSSDAWDYFHINSVDKDAEGNYLISARDACAIHKINGTSGAIIWRLHGKRSDFAMGNGTEFCFQHHARWLPHDEGDDVEVISLFDNSAHGTEHARGREVHTADRSSAKILRLNTTARTADLVAAYYPPPGHPPLLAKSQGSAQVLPGGNVLVNWGSEGAVTEYTAAGDPVFHAYTDSGALGAGVQNYRAFRFNWTGLPREEPAIVALAAPDDGAAAAAATTTVYVSWNGDTETAAWRFFEVVDGRDSRSFLGEVERTGFETKLVVPRGRNVERVAAEAVDKRGRVLRATREVDVEPEVLPAGVGDDDDDDDDDDNGAKTGELGELGASEGGEQRVLGAASAASSRLEEYGVLKVFRLVKDL